MKTMTRIAVLKDTLKPRLLCAAVGLVCIGLEPANAQNQLNVYGTCGSDAISVTLDVYDGGSSPSLVGYDLYRSALGTCAASVRLTDVPWSRQFGQHFTRQLVDAGRDPSVTYKYEVVGVDANRQPLDLYSIYFPGSNTIGYSNCGVAPIGLGTLHDFGYTLSFEPCAGSCYVPGLLEQFPPSLRDYADTGTVLLLYGNIVCGSIEGCLLNVDSSVVAGCTVPVATPSWSQVKATYR